MNELRGDLWTYHERGYWCVITTNGTIRRDGRAVMGRGVALQAAQRFPDLAQIVGQRLHTGNDVYAISHRKLFTFPVKTDWQMTASLDLIERSAVQLVRLVNALGLSRVFMVRPGCGNGGLAWDDVKLILAPHFDDRFQIVERAAS